MKLLIVSAGTYDDYRVVAVYAASKADDAKAVAELVGGRVEDEDSDACLNSVFPLYLNTFPAQTPPRGAKGYYWVCVERSGKVDVTLQPMLQTDGSLWPQKYELDSFALRQEAGRSTLSIRKSHWRLLVECYAASEDDAKAIGLAVKEEVWNKTKPPSGTL